METNLPEKRIWTKEEIKNLLYKNNGFLIRSVIKLYEFQTNEEKAIKITKEDNGIGFNAFDAEFLTDIAEKALEGRLFSFNQIFVIRKKMVKYSGQITNIANNL